MQILKNQKPSKPETLQIKDSQLAFKSSWVLTNTPELFSKQLCKCHYFTLTSGYGKKTK
jgi:hypothetical protein